MEIRGLSKLITVVFISFSLFLAGCAGDFEENSLPFRMYGIMDWAEKERDAEELSEARETMEEENALLSEDSKQIEDIEEAGYCYGFLTKEEKALYGKLLSILENLDSDVSIDTDDKERIEKVFKCVINDHPEIFYVSGFVVGTYTQGDSLNEVTFSGNYMYDREEVDRRLLLIEEKTKQILSGLPQGDEYEKVKYIYEYVIEHTEYDDGAPDNQNICSVLLYGKSVCQGYAKAVQYLLDKAGIYASIVSGTVKGEGHAWNLVLVDRAYYYVDATWGDASYVGSGGQEFEGKRPSINYEYLCVPEKQLLRTHVIDNVVPLPECNSMAANYYVREGAYFTTVNMARVKVLFERARENNDRYVTFKCDNDGIYDEMRKSLIEEQEVFQYLERTEGTIAYTDNKEQLSLSFWLQD